jgi:RimJ/RimL family protein N-acetyltransferase
LSGKRFSLRPVTVDDASFIVRLRRDPSASRFINETSSDVDAQREWILRYLERHGDWYFIITQDGDALPVGTVGIYDYSDNGNRAEWGRWILLPGSIGAIESALLTYRMAFERIGLDEVYCRTVADNRSVVSFHDSSGAARHALLKAHVTLRGTPHDMVEHRVTRATWSVMQPKLEALAARLARPSSVATHVQ